MNSTKPLAKVLMVQGTTSSAGKSLIVTALCRIFARCGWRVAPFKAQNMSNNAAVCQDGSEIGRAQFTQAQAAGIEPSALMNPILLKPEADSRSQVVIMGRPSETLAARDYYTRKQALWQVITEALDELRSQVDLVIIEGAGSPVELNLKHGDIVNMAVAKYANAPVLLVGDIDRGGVFAQLLGTLWLLEPDELALVKGLVVNKFRGDISLFTDGIRILEEKAGVSVLGVVPYVQHTLPEEDAVAIEPQNRATPDPQAGIIDIAVIQLPRISNFDDFDPLASEFGVRVRYVSTIMEFGEPHAVIIPGTKSTIADLQWMQRHGLDVAIRQYAGQGGHVVGICGGYQMLGTTIRDPYQVEAMVTETPGLGLLDIQTTFHAKKSTHQAEAQISSSVTWLAGLDGSRVTGYEIHMGQTVGAQPWLILQRHGDHAQDGAVTDDGRIWGCYLHGLFHNTDFRRVWLQSLGWAPSSGQPAPPDPFDIVANTVAAAIDIDFIKQLLIEQENTLA